MVLKFAVSKQEKVKDYPWVSTQVNSASGQINVALFSTYLHKEPSIKRRPHCRNLPVGVSRMPTSAIFEKKIKLLHCQFVDKFGKKSRWEIHETMWWAAHNILFMTSNHQTTNFVFHNFFREFFSVWPDEKENKLFIGPKLRKKTF